MNRLINNEFIDAEVVKQIKKRVKVAEDVADCSVTDF